MDFDRLWAAYPTEYAPCVPSDGSIPFANQCAIRFGIALGDGGVDLRTFPGVRCWHGHGGKHLLRGEELAAWMKSKPSMFGRAEIRTGSDESTYYGRRGLIFCRNFWGEGNQGDHIDLWNRDRMAGGSPGYIARSQEVWFWEIDAYTLDWINHSKTASEGSTLNRLYFRDISDASAREIEIAKWFLGNHADLYDSSLLNHMSFTSHALVESWSELTLIRFPTDNPCVDKLAFFYEESADNVSENGIVEMAEIVNAWDDQRHNGGKFITSYSGLGKCSDYQACYFDGQRYVNGAPSSK